MDDLVFLEYPVEITEVIFIKRLFLFLFSPKFIFSNKPQVRPLGLNSRMCFCI